MREALEKHMNELLAQGRSRARLTSGLNLFSLYLDETGLPWERFGVKEAQGFQTSLMAVTDDQGGRKYAPATVVQCMLVVKNFYAWAKKKRMVAENPFLRVKGVKQPKKLPKDIYETQEMDELLSWLSDFGSEPDLKQKRERYVAHVVAELMYSTGLTVGEVKTLRPEDVDLSRRTVTVFISRLGKKRTAFLSEYAAGVLSLFVEELREVILISPNYRDSRHLLFGTGAELTKTVNRVLKQGSEALNLSPCTTRMFRHALSLHLIKAGCDARFTQELCGHESLSTTQLYVRLDTRDLRSALDEFHPRSVVNYQ